MLSDTEYRTWMRASLAEFIERTFRHLNPGTPYARNWHIELIASRLEAVFEGRVLRLIINVPPRSLKSIMTSVAFVAWALGHKPTLQFICASYGKDLAVKHAQDCRNVMMSQWYRETFASRMATSRPALGDLRTTSGGGRFATSVGGVLTGLGGDMIVIDDPLKPDEAVSDVQRQAANDWLDNTVMSRFNDQQTGAMVIIMQRLHLDDVVGHVLQHGDWEVLSLPAIAEEDEVHCIDSQVWGSRQVGRKAGEALHSGREPLDVLHDLRARLGEYNFAGQYQQRPAPLGGGIVKREWLRYVEENEIPSQFDRIIQSWDTANKETQLADYSVCTTWGIKNSDRYLIDVYRQKVDFPKLKRAVIEQIGKFRPATVLVEDKASGVQLIQELRSMGIYCIKAIKPKGDKQMRMFAQTAQIESGFVKLPAAASWRLDFEAELTSFPKARYDDQVDSTSQALEWLTVEGHEPGILAYLRLEAEKLRLTPPE